jgi:hypothetical protein
VYTSRNIGTTQLTPTFIYCPPVLSVSLKTSINATTSDVFGPVDVPPKQKGSNAKLESYFKFETTEAKSERTSHDFEEIAARWEEQEFNNAHALTLREARCRQRP